MATIRMTSEEEANFLRMAEERGAVIGGGACLESEPLARIEPIKDEADLQARIVSQARQWGWLVYHTYDSLRSERGFPDLVLLRHDRMIVAELKRSRKEKPTAAQRKWLKAFQCIPGASVYVWSAEDWEWILKELS